jgi:hypothetical protein
LLESLCDLRLVVYRQFIDEANSFSEIHLIQASRRSNSVHTFACLHEVNKLSFCSAFDALASARKSTDVAAIS